ncbi:hypothetical protein J2X11_001924 [Aeromicrobium panaciterrae]|uniref:Uncharacterized protein n=1 Tax=Aeromicrobium panaciterrae TaxID=363861 RepID=A0ABU1UPJ8_9ACTN|nr:hypothetical protein [Aeromicrobium panaciterrae]MDR7087085.1 hypothetical protein [Aeromicrobium panaciterrae]
MTPPAAPRFLTATIARARHIPAGRWVTIVALGLIAAQVAWRAIYVSQSWFLVDDFYFLSDIATDQDDAAWYFRVHQGHFMPLSFVLVKLASMFGAFPWTAAAIEICAMQALAGLACWWMLRTLFGNRPQILVPLALYLVSPITMPALTWWAVAINQLPNQIAVFCAIAAHVMHARSQRWSHALLAAAFLVLGFASYTKTALLPVMLAILSVAYFANGKVGHRVVTVVQTQWRAWVLYLAISLGFVTTYLSKRPPSGALSGSFAELMSTTVLSSFGSALVGGPWNWSPFGDGPIMYGTPPELGVVLAWLLIVATVFVLWATRTRTLRALWMPVVYLAASIVFVYLGRSFVLGLIGGVRAGQSIQYVADSMPFVVLALALMMMSLQGAVEPSEPRHHTLLKRRPPSAVLAVVAAAVAIGSVVSTARMATIWNSDYAERGFVQNASAQIARDKPLLADVPVPGRIVDPLAAPRNLLSTHLAPLGRDLRTTLMGTDLSTLTVEGDVVPAVVDASPRTSRDESGDCPYPVQDTETLIRFPGVIDFPLWMAVKYRSSTTGEVPMTIGFQSPRIVPIERGQHTLFIATTGAYDRVYLQALVGQRLCVSSIRIGQLLPEASQ